MRTREAIEADIEKMRGLIAEAEQFKTISNFAGADTLTAILKKTRNYYSDALQSLDESNGDFRINYAKLKACLNLADRFLQSITNSQDRINTLKERLLGFNEELKKYLDAMRERETKRM